ncbi:MAG: SDR family oxidoreductase [Alphaproteobacteria bacterium]|nr:SDR family oxidoreductase [Alphaproteobacteria bacterium]
MDQTTSGKVAIVTGGSGGIGIATGRALATGGYVVVLSDVSPDRGEGAAREIGGLFITADVTREADVADLVSTTLEQFGRLDVMVCNAGIIGPAGRITDIEDADWTNAIAVLLNSVFYGMKHAARAMQEAGRGGVLMATTSIAAHRTVGGHAYNAAKHALTGLIRSVATDLSPDGIRVNGVAPGHTLTPMSMQVYRDTDAARTRISQLNALGEVIEPEDIAAAFAFLASDAARYITGQEIVVDGGWLECMNRPAIFDL